MALVVLGFGSNLGNRQETIERAYRLVEQQLNAALTKSSFYETEPWGNTQQPTFINSVAYANTLINPEELLDSLLKIEETLGRKRTKKWGPRTIDIDFLFYNDLKINTPNLILPHPYIAERRFVLEPLAEILPDFIHPLSKLNISSLLNNLIQTSLR
ncbi:MAG: 2-amino-4-hydroxy-6-hydroxymethyldihydropteridine diphosphokinase [Bacteroidia bacterium]|nr:2-amino-4-hydroxy-6-hydroxymethyldihydropteridine diphosphokinase [Bacteroidia bacterium]